jgi:protein disulfide-isomerase
MKRIMTILTAIFLMSNSALTVFADFPMNASRFQSTINWQTNYDTALNQAKETGKPLLLFFTGSDWCSWCHKLDDEVLNRPEFADALKETFIFVRLDYPQYRRLPNAEQNQRLLQRFDIKSYPTVLILDEKECVLGQTGYQAGGPHPYVTHLNSMIQGYLTYREGRNAADPKQLSHDKLRQLYETAKKLQNTEEAVSLMEHGLNNDRDQYFLCEKYSWLMERGQVNPSEAQFVRARILDQDPNNQGRLHYKVANIEFQALLKDKSTSPEKSTAPLVAYLKNFGDQDQENSWKVEMTISQTYLAQGQYAQSLEHAQEAYERAPTGIKSDVQKAIQQIKKQIAKKSEKKTDGLI